jgi:hypothetical protein
MRPVERAREEAGKDLRILSGVAGFSVGGALLSLSTELGPSYIGQAVLVGFGVLFFAAISIGLGYEIAAIAVTREF